MNCPILCQVKLLICFSGAFVFPFLIMLVLEGMPILLIELGIGQRLRAGCFGVWNIIHPNLGGIGLGSAVVAIVVGCYYNVIIAWCLYYLINSFRVRIRIVQFRKNTNFKIIFLKSGFNTYYTP